MVSANTKMKSTKTLVWVFISFMALIGAAFATPITVEDVNIQKTDGEYVVLVSLENANAASGVYTEVDFTIEEVGTSKTVGIVKVENNTEIFTYTLSEITDSLDLLKKGETYTITASTEDDSASESFLYGNVRETSGLDLIFDDVKVNGASIDDGDVLQVMNGETLKVEMRFTGQQAFDDARIMAFIEGYEHSPLLQSTDIFEVIEGKTYVKRVSLSLPADMNNQQDYKLRIVGANDLSGITYKDYTVYVDTERHRVDVLDLVMTPSSGVEPGQNMIANVRMKNRGQKSQDSVRVNVAVPELSVSESSYVSNLNKDEVATSDDMLLFIPESATAGQYDVEVSLTYDDGYTSSVEVFTMNVLSPKVVSEKNLLVSFKNNVDLVAGEEKTFEVVVANPNTESKPISLNALENAWANVEVTPSLKMIQGGASETFTVKITPKDSISGEKELTMLVKNGPETVSEFVVSTYVEDGNKNGINWINVLLAILLIIAIIILLTLVIAIARRRNDREDDEEISSEEYY